jgi:hypothetical protein
MRSRLAKQPFILAALGALACSVTMDFQSLDSGCRVGEKLCGGLCVETKDPNYGCSQLEEECSPCPSLAAKTGQATCKSGQCVASSCKSGFKACGGVCAALDDPKYGCASDSCEACPAGDGATCVDGKCTAAKCPRGFKACGDQCVSVTDPRYGCAGTSCTPCTVQNGTALCTEGGECGVENCRTNYKFCAKSTGSQVGTCQSESNPDYGCGAESCAQCQLENTSIASCNAFKSCAVAVCETGFGDCDTNQANGCETDLRNSKDNCSLCGRACEKKANAIMNCVRSACVISECEAGWNNCNKAIGDGCEVNGPCP